MKINPLHDRVVIRRLGEERTSEGGIVIPDTASAEKPSRGKVEAIGPGKLLDSGEVRQLAVQVGQEVLFGKYAGTEVKLGDVDYVVMREDDIMGVIEK